MGKYSLFLWNALYFMKRSIVLCWPDWSTPDPAPL